MSEPHLLNLPPPPSDTPSDFGPGTPTSGISQLSTVALREGERGKARPYAHTHTQSTTSNSSTNTLDAERADRISRLAGLERVAALRGVSQSSPVGQNTLPQPSHLSHQQGYFDGVSNIHRSTVGSASATGSIGGSVPDFFDKTSENGDDGESSMGQSDDGNASLVGFGETASSTLSGPISRLKARSAQPSASNSGLRTNQVDLEPRGSSIEIEEVTGTSYNA